MKKVWRVLIGTTMIAALMTGCGNSNASEETVASEMTHTEEVVEQAPQIVEAYGSVDAQTIKQIYLDFPATIADIYVNVGQEIKQGDKLIALDFEEYKASITQKEMELGVDKISAEASKRSTNSSTAQIQVLQKQIAKLSGDLTNGTDPDINAIEDSMVKVKSDLKQKEKELALQEELLKEGAGAQEEVNTLKNDIESLNNDINTYKERITDLKASKNIELSKLKSEVTALQENISESNKANNTAQSTYSVKEELSNMEVSQMTSKYTRADIVGNDIVMNIKSGVVKTISALEGNKVGNDGAALMEIIDKDSLIVKANVPEEFIKDVKIGAQVNIIPYADREAVFKGKVKDIQQMAVSDNGEVVIPVIIEATEASEYLCYGYSVDVEISY